MPMIAQKCRDAGASYEDNRWQLRLDTKKTELPNDFVDGYIKRQTMQNGQSFEYHYFRDGGRIRENQITDPNGFETNILYGHGGYREWLPTALPR